MLIVIRQISEHSYLSKSVERILSGPEDFLNLKAQFLEIDVTDGCFSWPMLPKKRSVIRIDAIYKASIALILSKRLHPTLNMKIDASNSKFVKSLKWPIFNAEHIQIFSLWKLGKKLKAQYVKFSSRNIEQTFTVNEIGCECHVRKQYGQRLWIIWICEKMIGFRISNRIGIIRFTILMKLAQRAFFPTTLAGWKIEDNPALNGNDKFHLSSPWVKKIYCISTQNHSNDGKWSISSNSWCENIGENT